MVNKTERKFHHWRVGGAKMPLDRMKLSLEYRRFRRLCSRTPVGRFANVDAGNPFAENLDFALK
jgi:hypothetical protein